MDKLEAEQKAKGHANRYQQPMVIFNSGGKYTYLTRNNFEATNKRRLASNKDAIPVINTIFPEGWDHENNQPGTLQTDKQKLQHTY